MVQVMVSVIMTLCLNQWMIEDFLTGMKLK